MMCSPDTLCAEEAAQMNSGVGGSTEWGSQSTNNEQEGKFTQLTALPDTYFSEITHMHNFQEGLS